MTNSPRVIRHLAYIIVNITAFFGSVRTFTVAIVKLLRIDNTLFRVDTWGAGLSAIYLTPASASYLTQFILSLAITLFLLNRLRSQRDMRLHLLAAFFVLMTTFTGLMVLDTQREKLQYSIPISKT